MQLVETEQADTEGLEILALVTHERYAGCHLQAGLGEPGGKPSVIGLADHHTRCLKAFRGHAAEAPFA